MARVQRALQARRPEPVTGAVLRDLDRPPQLVIDAVGRSWWDSALVAVRRDRRVARMIWNALAVEALAQMVDELPALPPA
jgi:hypothetical protein